MLLSINLIIKCIFSSYILFQSGNIFSKLLKLKSNNIGFCEKSFLGIIFISFIALFLNFFTPLSYFLNSIIFSLIILSFFIDKSFPIKEMLLIGLITSLILILAKTNNPDGGLYHLPYIQILNEKKIIFGVNNLHFRFGLATMFQYVAAVFNNFYLGIEGITIPIAIVVSYFIFFLQKEINKFLKKNLEIDFLISIIYIILLVSSLYSFNRYSNYGNDVSLHIYYFLVILISINYLYKKHDLDSYKLILILASFLIINKITFILVILFPILIFLNLKKKHLINSTTIFILIFSFLWILKNLVVSGCMIFPIPILCFESIEWTNIELVKQEKLAGEAWSKGWPDQDLISDYKTFISNYNWFGAWFGKHFFVILEKFLPILIFIFLFIFTFFIKGKKIILENFKYYKIRFYQLYFIIFVNFLLWFNFFPIYRYGYGFLIFFVIMSIILITFNLIKKPDIKFVKKYYLSILIMSYLLFGIKNIDRINQNFDQIYNGKPFPNINYSNYVNNIPIIHRKIIQNSFEYYYAPNLCFYNKAPCTNYKKENLNFKRLYNYEVLYLK